VPLDNARDLATEYSTPSGHAMAGASFYTYLFGAVSHRWVCVAAVLAVLFTGLSRPYLGVHYVEDILLGWPIGLSAGLVALGYGERIGERWNRLPYAQRIGILVTASLTLWVATIVTNGGQIDAQPRAFLGYAGTLTGIIIARPLELSAVNFDPKSSSILFKILRYLVSVALAILTLDVLGRLFAAIAANYSMIGYALQYIRYTALGIVSIFLAPWIFTRIGLAQTAGAGYMRSSSPDPGA
jgi:hypothetical protein